MSTDVTATRALASDSNEKICSSTVASTELGYITGIASASQTQINGKQHVVASKNKIVWYAQVLAVH